MTQFKFQESRHRVQHFQEKALCHQVGGKKAKKFRLSISNGSPLNHQSLIKLRIQSMNSLKTLISIIRQCRLLGAGLNQPPHNLITLRNAKT